MYIDDYISIHYDWSIALPLHLRTNLRSKQRRAEEEKFRTEQLRLQCKQLDLEMMREQRKPPTIFTGVPRNISPFLVNCMRVVIQRICIDFDVNLYVALSSGFSVYVYEKT